MDERENDLLKMISRMTDEEFRALIERKKREMDFLSSMEELKRKMILLGHTDYEEFCDSLWRGLGFKDEDVMALS